MSNEAASLDWAGLEVLTFDDCLERLSLASVGRIGFVDRGSPSILPVNFALAGLSIVFRSGYGSKLSAGISMQPVCFEIDSWNSIDHTGWSVLAKGFAAEVVAADEIEQLSLLKVRPWSHPELREIWVRILVEELTGRRIAP
jgi:nitroimidazol reductase NimA-like FMN-containing flavoprotein (pyridoxamine 5'-phosphate oxidase superfamily)